MTVVSLAKSKMQTHKYVYYPYSCKTQTLLLRTVGIAVVVYILLLRTAIIAKYMLFYFCVPSELHETPCLRTVEIANAKGIYIYTPLRAGHGGSKEASVSLLTFLPLS